MRWMVLLIALAALVSSAAVLSGCDDKAAADVFPVKLGGERFYLEVAADPETRNFGLMDRTEIAPDGGMIFVFPSNQVQVQSFWMKNCLVDMDIIYLDARGGVLTTYTMRKQPLKGEAGDPNETENEYSDRIRRTAAYSSKFPSQFVIEVKAGTVDRLGVKPGDRVEFDVDALKAMAD